jgi:hypothetical protein
MRLDLIGAVLTVPARAEVATCPERRDIGQVVADQTRTGPLSEPATGRHSSQK